MRKITKSKLDKILAKHKLWLEGKKRSEKADLSECDLSDMNLSDANLTFANLRFADLSFAYLSGAILADANLSYSNLSYSNLYRTHLSRANLSDANLSGAKLSHANLSDANLCNTVFTTNDQVKFFSYNNHIANYYDGTLTIGCESHPIETWVEKYKQIGKKHRFTEDEIEMYGLFIKDCAKKK